MEVEVVLQLIKIIDNMFDQRFLQNMYQQWSQGNEAHVHCWLEFVEMAAKVNGVTADVMMSELQKYGWFEWSER